MQALPSSISGAESAPEQPVALKVLSAGDWVLDSQVLVSQLGNAFDAGPHALTNRRFEAIGERLVADENIVGRLDKFAGFFSAGADRP